LVKFSENWLRKPIASFAVATSAVALTACSSPPKEIKAITGPNYAELMDSAEAAQTKGSGAEALGFFERAAKSDPSKKQPWLRIAQAQFDARNYGAAITASQEVLQRDNADVTAKSILAASGLRVSAAALEQLREANALGGSTREEAQTLARIMREALGESILPAPTAAAADKPAPRPPVRRAPTPAAASPAPAPAVVAPTPVASPSPAPAAAPRARPAPAPAEPRRNPFDALR
jgi:tetratricopeptide (TPR) repeat protein